VCVTIPGFTAIGEPYELGNSRTDIYTIMCLISIPIQLCIHMSFLSCGQPDDDNHVWLNHVLILTAQFTVDLGNFSAGERQPLSVTCNQCISVKNTLG